MPRNTVESTIESFPNLTITFVKGEPIYKSIKEVKKQIITNASLIESELGGGQYRLLGLVISAAMYNAITG